MVVVLGLVMFPLLKMRILMQALDGDFAADD
jgi:hypothetical protein